MSDLPIHPGRSGESVRDVQRRLAALGFDLGGDAPGDYGDGTANAVRLFQERRGLRVDGICGQQTWSSLVEAGHRLGERFLYHRTPMLRGDDIAALQRLLGALGFDAGRVDGIFGGRTAEALTEFQRNAGLTTDGICGSDTVEALRRLASRGPSDSTVAEVREVEQLILAPRRLHDRRIAVGETGGLAALAESIGRALVDAGAAVVVFHQPDESAQASAANEFGADAFVAVALADVGPCQAAYYAAEGYTSAGGRRLAELVLETMAAGGLTTEPAPAGMRLPVLRETRMVAVVIGLGPPPLVVARAPLISRATVEAVARWVAAPVEF